MIFLVGFAFLAGVVTILSPCILPVLPIVLASSLSQSKKRPIGIVLGFILSFTFFTLALSTLVKYTGIPGDILRNISVIIILLFGISLIIPKTQILLELVFSKLTSYIPNQSNHTDGIWSGFIIGLSLGLIWTPCVGPIIASVITLAATSTVTLQSVFITLSYSLGTAIPMLIIIYSGRSLLQNHPWLLQNTGKIQKIFGVLMIVVAIGLFFNYDRQFQTLILNKFPQYGAGLTKLENNDLVKQQLDLLKPHTSIDKTDQAPEIISGGEWINSKPLTIANLRGKVVLIDFWTYTCINCIRTLPYLQNWSEKYKDQGLIVIGVHSPEFEFEKDLDNVKKAVKDFGLTYPIVQDNNFDTWRAYANQYWPAKYLIDKDGNIRYTHFGERNYDETEKMIQQLLKENHQKVNQKIDNPTYSITSQTPEIYLGYKRIEYLDPNQNFQPDVLSNFVNSNKINPNIYALNGNWIINIESANPQKDAKLFLNFSAKEVYLVMKPKTGTNSQVKILLDNKNLNSETQGKNIIDSTINVTSDSPYQIIKLKNPSRHLLELEFLDSNTEIFAFTFG